ncbi:MAG: NUDIX domain-containing protein [Oscillospiraceae bacterium]
MKTVSVLIQHHAGPTGDVLICKKADGAWEFPNDRVRTNETDEAAAARIAGEQLGMTVAVGKLTMRGAKYPKDGTVEHLTEGNITHNTHTKCDVHLYYEAVNTWQTEPKTGVYTEFKWVHPSELGGYDFAGDDVNFMAKFDPWINGRVIPDVRMY